MGMQAHHFTNKKAIKELKIITGQPGYVAYRLSLAPRNTLNKRV
jgi:hypothetical protein